MDVFETGHTIYVISNASERDWRRNITTSIFFDPIKTFCIFSCIADHLIVIIISHYKREIIYEIELIASYHFDEIQLF